MEQGNAAYGKGDYDKALADYSEAIRLNPKLAEAYDNRGNVYQNKGAHDKALQRPHDKALADYDEAIRLNPAFTMAYNDRGYSHNAKGDHDQALADYAEAIRLKPNSPPPITTGATSLSKKAITTRRLPTSARPFASTRKIPTRTTAGAWLMLQEAIPTRRWPTTTRPSAFKPKFAAAYYNRGLCYGKQGEQSKADKGLRPGQGTRLQAVSRKGDRVAVSAGEPRQDLRPKANQQEKRTMPHSDDDLYSWGSGHFSRGRDALQRRKATKFKRPWSMATPRMARAITTRPCRLQRGHPACPTFPNAYYNRGVVYGGKGEQDKALPTTARPSA